MKWVIVFLFVVLIGIVGWIVFLRSNFNSGYTNVASISPRSNTATPIQNSFCKAKDLQTLLTSEGAAGSIYATVTIKNIGAKQCEIIGDNFIDATYFAKNVILRQEGQLGPNTILLSPNQIVYSQIHYPNGPQCSSGIKQTPVTFRYQISENNSVTFVPTGNLPSSTITTCAADRDITQLDVWSISLTPLH